MTSTLKELLHYQAEATAWPAVDSYEQDDEFVFEIDLPGMSLDEVAIKVVGDFLVVEAQRREQLDPLRVRYLCMERTIRGFRRVVAIPVPVDRAAGRATYADGVVTVRFPKAGSSVVTIRVERC